MHRAWNIAIAVLVADSRPLFTCGTGTGKSANIACACPPMTSTITGTAPLYGTCVTLMPA